MSNLSFNKLCPSHFIVSNHRVQAYKIMDFTSASVLISLTLLLLLFLRRTIFVGMGDSETVVASAPTMANYRAGYSSAPAADGDFAASTGTADGTDAMPQDANVDSVNMESIDVKQETLTTVLHGISENPNNLANTSVDSSQPAYDSSVNGNDVGETRTVALTGVSENGVTDDVHQSVDGALSAEEERLWSIVRANSLEFNAWTALIEETEKMAVVS